MVGNREWGIGNREFKYKASFCILHFKFHINFSGIIYHFRSNMNSITFSELPSLLRRLADPVPNPYVNILENPKC